MEEVENQTLNLLKTLIENREKIYNKINEAKEKLIPVVNIINILGNTYYEVSNSSLLYNILKIKFKYDNKEINFAKDFSEYIIKEKLNDSVNINSSNISVYSEERPSIESKRRMDLFIHSDNFEIIIENKIGAGDQKDQLKDYYENRIKNNDKIKDNIFIVYLTRNRDKPSEFSIDRELIADLENKNKICYLSHDDIAEWIKNGILNKYKFLKFDEKYQSIYSALIQIRDNEKIITNPNEENNMGKEEIKKFFEREDNNYFGLLNKDELSADNFNDIFQLLKNAKEVIIDYFLSRDIEYYSNIKNEVEQYIKDKGIYHVINSKEEVMDRFYSGAVYSRNMAIPIENNWDIQIWLEQHINYHFCISVYSEKANIINQLKSIKNEVIEILNDCKEGLGDESNWVYQKFIDTTKIDTTKKDEAKDIADKIIELYEFLRDNINFDNA